MTKRKKIGSIGFPAINAGGEFVTSLPNGLTVALEPLPHVRSLTAGVWIRTGSVNESERLAGISHFIEHLVFKGTQSRSAREIMDAIESRGGQMNAFTSREYTCYYIKCLDQHLPVALEILADIVQRPTYHDFDKEKSVILEEISASMDVPDEYVHDLLSEQMWPRHPLGRPVAGSIESVSGIALDDVRAYKDSWYQPNEMYVSIAGRIDQAHALELVQQQFGGMNRGANDIGSNAPAFTPGIQTIDRDVAQNHVAMAFTGKPVEDERRPVCDLLGSILGGGSTSRLFERIREDEGLAYSVYAFNSPFRHTGMLGLYAAVAPENLQRTLDIAAEELRDLAENVVPDEELRSNKEQLKGGLVLALEGTFNRMARLARSLIYFGEIISIDEIIDEVDSVAADQIRQLAQETFVESNCAASILGPLPAKPVAFALG